MNTDNNTKHSISDFVSTFIGQLGIVSLDVGMIQESTGEWTTVEKYCVSEVSDLHKAVSDQYKQNYEKEPINFLYEYWRDSQEKDEIITYSFNEDGYLNDENLKQLKEKEKEKQPSTYELAAIKIDDNAAENSSIKEKQIITDSCSSRTESWGCFIERQKQFTESVISNFNKKLKNKIQYVTIVLFRTEYDSRWHLSYNAVIVSNNLSFLDKAEVNLLFDYISRGNYLKEIQALKKNVSRESIKSAVSAIMSRNMSHNLGSHYLYYTKSTLEKLADKSGNLGPDIRGAAKVLSYIQSRMDYLATIVSNDKYPYGSVNFKSQILDELTIDDFSKRHYNTDTPEDFRDSLLKSIKQVELIKSEVNKLDAMYRQYDQEKDSPDLRKQISDSVSTIVEQISSLDKRSVYNRTTNFLLTNLIRSENYSRPSIIGSSPFVEKGVKPLYLFVRIWDGSDYQLFTGSTNPNVYILESETESAAKERERLTKEMLSRINLALPGGTMSCHAFYNVLENFIRNSAKYSWTDDKKSELTFTLSLKVDEQHQRVECVIYDDKHDALVTRNKIGGKATLLRDIQQRLAHMKILAEDNTIDKENKGLKEMVFSAVWLKANESEFSFADIITMIESANPRKKIHLIRKYAFDVLAVDDKGNPSKEPQANLAIKVNLPIFSRVESLHGKKVQDLIKLHTDVVEIPKNSGESLFKDRRYDQVFPRVFQNNRPTQSEINDGIKLIQNRAPERDGVEAFMLKEAINRNFGDIDQYSLRMAAIDEPGTDFFISPESQIVFDTHFSTKISKKALLRDYFGVDDERYILRERRGKYAYVDTISGNNFTKTLQGLFTAGLSKDLSMFKSYDDKYLSLKIKESALTRITIIDERLFNSIKWNYNLGDNDDAILDIRSTEYELMLKNIRVLNITNIAAKSRKKNTRLNGHKVEELPFFTGSQFLANGPYAEQSNASNFLSIHLGLIEKLLKSKELESEEYCGARGNNPFDENRIVRLMGLLTKTFGILSPNNSAVKLHICIHSGRGNFSKELEGPLREYPFISLAALENTFNNSKYLLSQLFYNTIFLGKGEINH